MRRSVVVYVIVGGLLVVGPARDLCPVNYKGALQSLSPAHHDATPPAVRVLAIANSTTQPTFTAGPASVKN